MDNCFVVSGFFVGNNQKSFFIGFSLFGLLLLEKIVQVIFEGIGQISVFYGFIVGVDVSNFFGGNIVIMMEVVREQINGDVVGVNFFIFFCQGNG